MTIKTLWVLPGAEQGSSRSGSDHFLKPAPLERAVRSATAARREDGHAWLAGRLLYCDSRHYCIKEMSLYQYSALLNIYCTSQL